MKFQLGTFMYKLKYNKLPSVIPHMFVSNENIHSHNTRNKNGYLIPSVRTNCRKFTMGYAGPILWNSFPQQLRQLPSEVLFKKKLKSILLAMYWITHKYLNNSNDIIWRNRYCCWLWSLFQNTVASRTLEISDSQPSKPASNDLPTEANWKDWTDTTWTTVTAWHS